MFLEIFELFLKFIGEIFNMLKRIELFEGFSLFSLAIALFFCWILGILLNFIFGKDSD